MADHVWRGVSQNFTLMLYVLLYPRKLTNTLIGSPQTHFLSHSSLVFLNVEHGHWNIILSKPSLQLWMAVGPNADHRLTQNSAVGTSGESFAFLIKKNELASKALCSWSSPCAVSKDLLAKATANKVTVYPCTKRRRNLYLLKSFWPNFCYLQIIDFPQTQAY